MTTTFLIERGDVAINRSSGTPRLIADGDKLRQDLREGLSTGVRDDNIGAGLEDVVAGQAATPSFVERQIQRRVRVMVSNIQSLQDRFNREERPRSERLVRLATVQVSTVADDPTAFYVRAEFISGQSSREPVSLSGRVS